MRRFLIALIILCASTSEAVQFGAGTGTGYPTAIDTVQTRTNFGGATCSSAVTDNDCAEWNNDLQGAVTAIQTELGTLPKGGAVSVKARLDTVDTSLSGKVTAVTGSGNIASSGGTTPNITLTGIVPTASGGSGIAYFTAAGPTVARVYTFPDAAATILYSGGALGTPSSGVATNLTGAAAGLTAGTVTTNANLTGHITSVGNAAVLGSFTAAQLNTAISDADIATGGGTATGTNTGDQTNISGNAATVTTNANLTGPITSTGNATTVAAQTGTGSTFVMQASPTLTTPNIGTPSAGVLTNATGLPLTTGVTGILPGANGGTANGFFAVSGPTTSLKTFTFPDASSTILYSGGALGTPSSGVGTNLTGIPAASILAGSFGAGAYVVSTSLQAATIELGHATDTTLGRVSAGVASIEGATIATLPTANVFTENQTISNTAPALILTDTTAIAKSLTIAVDANLVDLRESAGASGSLLTLDLANARVGIGTTGPGATLDVVGTGRFTASTNNPVLSIKGSVTAGSSKGILISAGQDASDYSLFATNYNTSPLLLVTGNGNVWAGGISASTAPVMAINSTGNVGIGTTSPPTGGGPALALGQGTDPTGIAANTAGIYVKDVAGTAELFTFDEAGNFTQQSAADSRILNRRISQDTMPWAFSKTNVYTGEIWEVDMGELIAEVERLSGKRFAARLMTPKRDWQADQEAQVAVRDTEIATATKSKADRLAEAEQETDAVKKSEKQRQADEVKIPTPYTAKRPPSWMQRRGVTAVPAER